MGLASSTAPTELDELRPDDSTLYPDLPVKKKFGETVVKLTHVKKGVSVCFQF